MRLDCNQSPQAVIAKKDQVSPSLHDRASPQIRDNLTDSNWPKLSRSPISLTKRATMISMRKLTNSLFDEPAYSNAIKEEADQELRQQQN